jgi:hypothetical protein
LGVKPVKGETLRIGFEHDPLPRLDEILVSSSLSRWAVMTVGDD